MKRIFLIPILFCAGIASEAQASSLSIWNPSTITYSTATPSQSYTVGTELEFLKAGTVTGFAFFKDSTDTTTSRNTNLWSDDGNGTKLATCTTSSEPTGSNQWITCNLTTPFPVSASSKYIVSYDLPVSTTNQVYTSSGVCNQAGNTADFTCLSQDYIAGLTTFPTFSSSGSTFFADVLFTPCP